MPTTQTPRRARRSGIGKRDIQPISAPLPKSKTITSLSELEQAFSVPVVVDVFVGVAPLRFEGRRLKPFEEREVMQLLNSAFPPLLPKDQTGGEDQYDFRNPDYLTTKENNRRKARALALYLAFPLFSTALDGSRAAGSPKPTQDEILNFVETRPLDVGVLDLAFEMVTREIVMVDPRRVGFTSGNNSPAS